QQVTGPIMAKGFEDTALYLYNPLVSLNEVGGWLRPPDSPVKEFHSRMRERLKNSPYSVNTTSTHDTKRSDDVRARIDVLSEMPAEWEKRLRLWSRWNEDKRTEWESAFQMPTKKYCSIKPCSAHGRSMLTKCRRSEHDYKPI